MKNQNSQNKILGGGEPNLRSKFGAKEFYFGYFGFVFLLFIFYFLFSTPALAQYQLETALPTIPGYPSPSEGLPEYINYLFVFGLGIVGITALGVMIAGGIQYILAAGNMAKTADAKDRIIQALIGMGFLLVSYLLLRTINPDLVNLRNPDLGLIKLESKDLSNVLGDIGKGITLEELKKADEGAILNRSSATEMIIKQGEDKIMILEKGPGGELEQRFYKLSEIEKELQKK